jgi:Sulfotransferase family
VSAHAPKYFFVHIQKAAGTSLVFRLRRHFGRAAIYPPESDQGDVASVISVDHLLERWRAHRDTTRVVTGHFPLCTVELLGDSFTTLTVLRDPVERTLSYLRHHREMTPRHSGLSLEAIYADPFRFHGLIHNHMVKMFSLTPAEMTDGLLTSVEFTPDRLDRAKERLAHVDVVGVQANFEKFCDGLTRRFGWDLGGLTHVNRTEPVDVSEAFRARIAEDNAMDVELYEFALQLTGETKGRRGERTSA